MAHQNKRRRISPIEDWLGRRETHEVLAAGYNFSRSYFHSEREVKRRRR